jgi:hypothetical protein
MKQLFKVLSALAIAVGLVGCIAAPIDMTPQTEQRLRAQPPIRFLLTFGVLRADRCATCRRQ